MEGSRPRTPGPRASRPGTRSAPAGARRQADRSAVRQRASLRDHGLDLVARANRWLIAGAVAVTGAVALIADHAFHARAATRLSSSRSASRAATAGTSTSGASTSASSTATTGTSTTATTGTSTAAAPAPATASPSAVVSGGS